MWANAAKWLAKFDEAVLTALDVDGYPVSVRVDSRKYDAKTGSLPTALPEALGAVEGPANLLCHFHDEKLWRLNAIQFRGRIEKSDGGWVFQTTKFDPPRKPAFFHFLRNVNRSAQKYLDKRGLNRPEVSWAEIKELRPRTDH